MRWLKILMLSATLVFLAMPAAASYGDTRLLSRPTVAQRKAELSHLVRTSVNCIAKAVATDARFDIDFKNLAKIIVDAIPQCSDVMYDLMQEYDRQFGKGAGEDYLMGPYLDALPAAVVGIILRRR